MDEYIKLRWLRRTRSVSFAVGRARPRKSPTLFLTNHFEETGSKKYRHPLRASRNRVQSDGLWDQCQLLPSRLFGERGPTQTWTWTQRFTVSGQWLLPVDSAKPPAGLREGGLPSNSTASSSRPRDLIQAVTPEELIVRFERRSHNPILREAALDRDRAVIPWLGGRRIRFAFA